MDPTSSPTWYRLLADAVLALHLAVVLFVVLGLVVIFVGRQRWPWVRRRRWRQLHLAAIGIVVLQSWLGLVCPLTTLEMALRQRAGEASYAGSFIAHWMQALLYYDAPAWVFALIYSLFGMVVAASWLLVRPHPRDDP